MQQKYTHTHKTTTETTNNKQKGKTKQQREKNRIPCHRHSVVHCVCPAVPIPGDFCTLAFVDVRAGQGHVQFERGELSRGVLSHSIQGEIHHFPFYFSGRSPEPNLRPLKKQKKLNS